MQLFEMEQNDKLILGKEIKPILFQSIHKKHGNTKESDVEELIVSHPELLNCSEDQTDPEILIISRQLSTQTNKRADLVAIDRQGYLITIEVKRDAQDEKNRSESMEFQSIRYAASHRTLNIDGIIHIFAQYLCDLEKQKSNSAENNINSFIPEAERQICRHLKDIDDEKEIRPGDLSEYLDPTDRQKIYLVASDFAEDCLSACAWLREHKIDIYCFKLQPYRIKDSLILHQERLIPPTALDDFYIGTKEAKEKAEKQSRCSSIKPVKVFWKDEEVSCTAWSSLLVFVLKKVLEKGFSPDQLPLPHTFNEEQAKKEYYSCENLKWQCNNEEKNIYIDKHGSKTQLLSYIKAVLLPYKKELGTVSVTLADGSCENL